MCVYVCMCVALAQTLNCLPIAHIDHMKPEKLGTADLVEEMEVGKGRVVKVTGIQGKGRTATCLLRGSNKLVRHMTHTHTHTRARRDTHIHMRGRCTLYVAALCMPPGVVRATRHKDNRVA